MHLRADLLSDFLLSVWKFCGARLHVFHFVPIQRGRVEVAQS
jgi:hypothetical protein